VSDDDAVQQRTTVNADPAEQVPRSWLPLLRLVAWLRTIFPNSVIDIEEVRTPDDHKASESDS